VEKIHDYFLLVLPGHHKPEFRGLGHQHQSPPHGLRIFEDGGSLGRFIDQKTRRHVGERNDHPVRSDSAYPGGHALGGVKTDGNALPIRQGAPFKSPRAGPGRAERKTETGYPRPDPARQIRAFSHQPHPHPAYSILRFFNFSIRVVRFIPSISAA
jgi:hypothetical protein